VTAAVRRTRPQPQGRHEVGDLWGVGAVRARARDEIAAFVQGMHVIEPGIVPVVWHPERRPGPTATPSGRQIRPPFAQIPTDR
jgi:hypothetical protein